MQKLGMRSPHIVRSRARCDVKIMWLKPHEHVSNATARKVRNKSIVGERLHHAGRELSVFCFNVGHRH